MKFLMMVLTLSISSLSFAQGSERGGHDGGGGQGIVCYNNQNQIQSVELLDLYEGRNLEGLNYGEISGSYEDILIAVTESSDTRIKEVLVNGYKIIKPGLKFTPKGMRLKPIQDSNTIFIPVNCLVEQIVNFQGPSRVFIVTDFWEKLSETNKAALIIHEILWTTERGNGALYSSRVRRQVARMFANNYSIQQSDFIPQAGDIQCWIENEGKVTGEFYVAKDACSIVFKEINSGDRYGIHTSELYEDECTDWKKFYLLNQPTERDIEATNINTHLDVIDQQNNIRSHTINLRRIHQVQNGVSKFELRADITNWEFPGFDTKNHTVDCYYY